MTGLHVRGHLHRTQAGAEDRQRQDEQWKGRHQEQQRQRGTKHQSGDDRHGSAAEARDIFRRSGDRWGIASTLWRTADLAIARHELDEAEAALQEAHAVMRVTQRQRWIANTLSGLAEVALLRGEVDRAVELLEDARGRYAARDDAFGVESVDERLAHLAK